eukprot:CAMPEP_0115740552 /NCGR_PEP_ID=MMETSP0272-20121206/89539_1 /TAXON_ID=71861 /ORGANISM="Scrippsiella trochoidea, Strain CCMP3099" /LENGTH=91 /DNA_ID=CAMNT_0003185183 /DNA_START=12 /DNA_END=284 /DNA_ORIENTATION=+
MSLRELRELLPLIKDLCVTEGWADMRSGELLRPETVNLYHFTHHHICAATAPEDVIVRLTKPVENFELVRGMIVTQIEPSGSRCMAVAEGL